MSTLFDTEPLSECESFLSPDDRVRTQVWNLLTAMYPQGQSTERRRERRYPFPYLIRLRSVAEDGITPATAVVTVVGKHLSERGLGFYHPRPLADRRMIASLDAISGPTLSFLVDITWCRFRGQGWYESGGRFLQTC